jgi:DNA repair exonuclease SbcCD ATPase subunit
VNVTQAYRHKLQQERESLTLDLREQQSIADAATEYESQLASWKLAIAWHEKSTKAAKLEMDALAKPVGGDAPPVGSIDLLNRSFADAKALERSAERVAREASDKLVAISARCKAASEDVVRRKQQLGEQVSAITSRQLAEIRQLLAACDAVSQQRQTVSEELANLRGKAAATVKQLRKLRTDRRKICERAKWLDTLKRSRDVIKRDRLPARVIAVMLRRTTSKLNEYLLKLGVPFTAIADPEQFSFTIRHRDGTKEAANRLSTGQSLCLGVAFWLARADVFAGQLPMFWFDEPVANLDAERKVQVAELFGKLGQELAKNGRQGIVITHDDAIIKTATEVIRL